MRKVTNMKKWFFLTAMIIVVMMLPLTANASVRLNRKKATITVGKTVRLKVKGSKSKVKWSSSNKKVAVVNAKGKVKARKVGKATITAKIGKKKLRCRITVKAATSGTVSQQNAVKKAKQYLKYMAFSKEGLVEQLVYEGFSEDDARYAVEHISVDWYEQARIKGASYLKYSAFSHIELVRQLIYEGFTDEEAEYGVRANGL